MMRAFTDIAYSTDSPACALDMYLPDGDPERAYLYFHGGGLSAGDKGEEPVPSLAKLLTDSGAALISANYRLMPGVSFPAFLEDSAAAAAWALTEGKKRAGFLDLYIGGSSAGAYLSALLCFDAHYLAAYGLNPLRDVAGYVLDAGQPTTHYAILSERGADPDDVRVDEAAPIFHLRRFDPAGPFPRILNITAENDIKGRPEQNALMLQTMRNFGYPAEKILDCRMLGFSHCGYFGYAPYHRLTRDFVCGGISVCGTMQIPRTEE